MKLSALPLSPLSSVPSADVPRSSAKIPLHNRYLPLDSHAMATVEINSTPMRVLFDTGASDSYLDTRHADKFGDDMRQYPKPVKLRMFDGSSSSSGAIMHYVDTELTLSSHTDEPIRIPIRLNSTTLCDADVVVGSNWIHQNKAAIDLANGLLTLPLPTIALHSSTSPSSPSSPGSPTHELGSSSPGSPAGELESSSLAMLSEGPVSSSTLSAVSTPHSRKRQRQRIRKLERSSPSYSPGTYPNIIELPINRYESIAECRSSPMYAVLRAIGVPSPSSSVEETKELPDMIPGQYHDFLDIFDPKPPSDDLPPPRAYDMRVNLTSSAKLVSGPLYRQNQAQKDAMFEIIQRELKSGKIRRCQRPYGSIAFMVPKPGSPGKYRMVIDYKPVNAHTVGDAYPLPLISSVLDTLSSAKFFTKLDLPGAYQLLRMAEGHEAYTAFKTEFGMFESLVVRDGLKTAPAVFQHFINDILAELIGKGVISYIDDIVVYASTLEDLRRTTRRVFELLRGAGLFVKAEKCEFEKSEILFLGFFVSHKGVRADPKKVDAVRSFPSPTDLRSARSFVGLASYYRRFVPNFSDLVAPITKLTQKDAPFVWGPDQEAGFNSVKAILSEAPVIRTFDVTREAIIQTDASYFGWGFVVSQIFDDDGLEHPIFIESGRFSDTETRYSTSEKEFLAIVQAFKRCKHLLIQVPCRVITDHMNLKYWMRPMQLTHRQIRWSMMLAPFTLTIEYRPGKYAVVPDALSRREDYHLGKGASTTLAANFVQPLPNFGDVAEGTGSMDEMKMDLLALGRNERLTHLDDAELLEGLATDNFVDGLMEEMKGVVCTRCSHETCRTVEYDGEALEEIRRSTRNPDYVRPSWSTQGFLMFGDRIYVPKFKDLRLRLIKLRHESVLAGHPGRHKTQDLVERDYIWPGLASDVRAFVDGCQSCQRSKPSHHSPYGSLKSLNIAERPWEEISLDFVEPLPASGGFDSILVVVDRLTKWAIFIPAKTTWKASDLAQGFIDYVVSQHGLPKAILSDRGSKFVSIFWRALMARMDVKLRLSSAYQPQTDGQTERTNQSLEHYLRVHCDYNQRNWSKLLGQASFAYNNTVHSTIKCSPFFANFGYDARWASEFGATLPGSMVEDLSKIHATCREMIVEANDYAAKFYDNGRSTAPVFEKGHKVMLSTRDIKTKRPAKKLDWKFVGPYEVLERIGTHAYRLKLPTSAKIHDVFHISRLEPHRRSTFGEDPPPEPFEVDNEQEFEVESIVDERMRGSGKNRHKEYLVRWKGYEGMLDETSWVHEDHVDETQALDDYEAEVRLN